MSSKSWMRIAAGLLALFSVAHTLGTINTDNSAPGVTELIAQMRNSHFVTMGSNCTAWDFFHGLGLLFSTSLGTLTALAWQVGALSEIDPQRARPIAITLLVSVGTIGVLSWLYFFIAPIAISVLAAACIAIALQRLGVNQASERLPN